MNNVGPMVSMALKQLNLVPVDNGTVHLCFLDSPYGLGVRTHSHWVVQPLRPISDRWIETWDRIATHLGSSLAQWCATADRIKQPINGWQAMLPSQVLQGGEEPSALPASPPKLELT